jgi:hypothetical protein
METGVDFEKLAQDLSAARMMLRERVSCLEAEISALKKKSLPAIRKWAEATAEDQLALYQAIEENPGEFVKPRTRILHGIKFGIQKKKGEVTWDDEERVIFLIKKHFPELIEGLIRVKETPIKNALAEMAAVDLKKLGVSVENDTDEVFIKATDSEIDKIVDAILKTETE